MRKPAKRITCVFAGIIACANLSVFDALAQNYPVKPIRLIVGYTAGGATDASARIVAQKSSEHCTLNDTWIKGTREWKLRNARDRAGTCGTMNAPAESAWDRARHATITIDTFL